MLTLVHNNNDSLGFRHYATQAEFGQYFNLSAYDPAAGYNPQDTLVLVHYIEYEQESWFKPLVERGFKVVVDHLWDGDVDRPSEVNESGHLVLRAANWLWYHSSLMYRGHGYNSYQPNRSIKYPFFMPMNRQEWHRDLMVERLKPVLDHALWSYRPLGKELPGDTEEGVAGVPWRAYTNPDWYNTTVFSVVAESFMRTRHWAAAPYGLNYRTEISEKTFKPMAFYHPYIVFGSEGTLRYLRAQGFESYGELFDESYDDILDDQARFDRCVNSVFLACDLYEQGNLVVDAYTQAKLQHNHNRFFDLNLVKQGIRNDIVARVMDYAL